MTASQAAATMGRKGGKARAKKLSARKRKQIAKAGGMASAKARRRKKRKKRAVTAPVAGFGV